MKLFLLAFFLLSVQAAKDKAISLPDNFCSEFPAASSACKSFKELADHEDSEILSILRHECRRGGGHGGATYICFRDGQDKFLAVAFNMPDQRTKAEEDRFTGKSSLCLDEYDNGIPGSQQHSWVEWMRTPVNGLEGTTPITGKLYVGDHVAPGEIVATVDPTEITVSRSFANKSGSQTDYKFAIRRSTKRWVETYKTDTRTYTETGHCAAFNGQPK